MSASSNKKTKKITAGRKSKNKNTGVTKGFRAGKTHVKYTNVVATRKKLTYENLCQKRDSAFKRDKFSMSMNKYKEMLNINNAKARCVVLFGFALSV